MIRFTKKAQKKKQPKSNTSEIQMVLLFSHGHGECLIRCQYLTQRYPRSTQLLISITNCEKGGKPHLYCIPMITTLLLKTGLKTMELKTEAYQLGILKSIQL